jgi:hypothetical protein
MIGLFTNKQVISGFRGSIDGGHLQESVVRRLDSIIYQIVGTFS